MRISALAAFPLAMALVGCTSLEAVRTASSKLVTASNGWNDVAKEFDASCVREQQYNRAKTCTSQADTSKRIVAANATLTNYFQALADTASDQNYTVQPGLDALAKSAEATPGIVKGQASATFDLVSLLTRWATSAAREKALQALIGDGVPPASRVLDVMHDYVADSVEQGLKLERNKMDQVFFDYVYPGGQLDTVKFEAMCAHGPRAYELGEGPFLAALEYCRRLADVNTKLTAISDYRTSIETAQKTLKDLNSSKSKLTAKELITQLYKDGKDLDAKVTAVEKAYSTEKGQ